MIGHMRTDAELSIEVITVAEKRFDDVAIVRLSGEIDVYTSAILKARLDALVEDARRQLIINLDDIQFIDSTGLGVLVYGLKAVRELDGGVAIVVTNPRITRAFEVTGLTSVFMIFDTESSASASFTN